MEQSVNRLLAGIDGRLAGTVRGGHTRADVLHWGKMNEVQRQALAYDSLQKLVCHASPRTTIQSLPRAPPPPGASPAPSGNRLSSYRFHWRFRLCLDWLRLRLLHSPLDLDIDDLLTVEIRRPLAHG